MKEELMKEKYEEAQTIYAQLQKIEERMEEVNQKKANANETIITIEKYHDSSKKEILFPISTGIFAKKESKNFIVNIGSNIFIEMNKDQLKRLIEKQKENLEEANLQIQKSYSELQQKMLNIEAEMQKLQE